MDIKTVYELDTKKDVLVLGLFDGELEYYSKYNSELYNELKTAITNKTFEQKFGSTYSTKISNSAYHRIVILNLGKKEELIVDKIRRIAGRIIAYLKTSKYANATTNIPLLLSSLNKFDAKTIGRVVAEGLILASYTFDKYLAKKNSVNYSVALQISKTGDKEFNSGVSEGTIIAESTNLAKDMINEPSNIANPDYMVSTVKQVFSNNKSVKLKIMEMKELEKEGLGALVGVGKGSDIKPKLIIIEYNTGNSKDKYTAIVGKGVTFDTGGYDIKPAGEFADMKDDMSGGAAVIGTILAVSKLGIKKNILGVIPVCENMVSGGAQKPGDIVRAYNGKTIEIGNTDAEGRLILADALAYAEKNYNVDTMIDLATLTGACMIALGCYTAGFVTNNQELGHKLINAGTDSYDRVWQLPFHEEYQDTMDGDISDLRNISIRPSRRYAGAITGGVFLSKFVDKAKWAHIDIAGVAYLVEAKEYNQKYGSGAGVRLLTYYFMKN